MAFVPFLSSSRQGRFFLIRAMRNGKCACYRDQLNAIVSSDYRPGVLTWGSVSSNGKSIGHLCCWCFPSGFIFFANTTLNFPSPFISFWKTEDVKCMSIVSSRLNPHLLALKKPARCVKVQRANSPPFHSVFYLCFISDHHLASLIKTD